MKPVPAARLRVRVPALPPPVRWRLLVGGREVGAGQWVEVDSGRVEVEVRVDAALAGGRCAGAVCCEVLVHAEASVDLSLPLAAGRHYEEKEFSVSG